MDLRKHLEHPHHHGALTGLGILLITGTLTWEDILNDTGAWNTLIWFSALVMMASFLNSLGFIPWFGQTMGDKVGDWVGSPPS